MPRGSRGGARPCRPRIEAAGHPNRTPLVLARERGLYRAMVGELLTSGEPDRAVDREPPRSGGAEPTVSMEDLERGLASGDAGRRQAAAFVAGRCDPERGEDGRRLDTLLREILDTSDPAHLGSRALAYVEASMSLVLRGHEETGRAALAEVVRHARGSMGDHLAAFYLAELGDASGYPILVHELQAPTGFTRLMAARHLAGFLPYDGQPVGGETVDVRSRLLERFDDEDETVAVEIPGLLAEAEVDDLRSTLADLASGGRHAAAVRAAEHVLALLDHPA